MGQRTRRLVTLGVLALLVIALVVGAFVKGSSAQAATAQTTPEQQLADKYAPYVVVRVQDEDCGPGEPYRPVPVGSVLGDEQVVLRGPGGQEVKRAPTAADLAGLADGYYLDFPGDPLDPGCGYEQWFRSKKDVPTSVYGRVATDPDNPGTLVLQYWFWWVFNDWNDKHEGDWEMIQLQFRADTAEVALDGAPESVAYAQHEGSEVSAWNDPKLLRDGDHVAVYPGEGSHAAYFTQARWFGKSAAAGFGCDNTGVSDGLEATVLKPQVEMLSDDLDWLTFTGRWGQKAPSFNNGPTGPNTKAQWNSAVVWQQEEGRPSAVALPTVLSVAEESFCGLTAAGSLLFIDLLDSPVVVLTGLVVTIGLLVLLLRATRWRGSPVEPDRERTAGQILTGPLRILRAHGGQYGGVMLALMGLLLVSYWVQVLLQRPAATDDLALVGAPSISPLDWLALAAVGVATVLLTSWSIAYSIALTRDLPDPENGRLVRDRATRRGTWRSVLTYVVIVACTVTLILIPVAIYLYSRWAVATPASVVEDMPVGAAGQRSADLTKGRRWRALAIMIGVVLIASVPGALVGALLLLLTSLTFSLVNVVVILITAVAIVCSAIAMALHFYDLRNRARSSTNEPRPQEASA